MTPINANPEKIIKVLLDALKQMTEVNGVISRRLCFLDIFVDTQINQYHTFPRKIMILLNYT